MIEVASNNPDAQGVDLHLHESSVAGAQADVTYVRSQGVTQELISTEFSLVDLWNDHAFEPLGDWGTQNGYRPAAQEAVSRHT